MPLPLGPGDAWSSVSLPPREGTRPTAWAKALAPPEGLTDPHTHGRLEDEPCFVPPFQGLDRLWVGQPGALPRAGVCRAVGAPGSCPTRRFGFTGGSPWPTPLMARRLSRNDAVGREALTRRQGGRAVSALAGARPAAGCRCHLPCRPIESGSGFHPLAQHAPAARCRCHVAAGAGRHGIVAAARGQAADSMGGLFGSAGGFGINPFRHRDGVGHAGPRSRGRRRR